MAQAIVTQSMQAKASVLLAHADRWSRGTRNEDGAPFYLFSGSKGATYVTSANGCSCPSFTHRGACSHHAAVRQHQVDAAAEYAIEQQLADIAAKRQKPL